MLHLFGFMVEQGAHPFVQILFGAVVGVQGDGDVGVFRRDFVREGCEGKRAGDAVVDALPGEVGGAAYGDLDDAIGFRLGETLECGVQGLCAGHIDRGIGVTAAACGVQHLRITFRRCNSHASIIARPYPTCHVTTFAIFPFRFPDRPLHIQVARPTRAICRAFSSHIPTFAGPTIKQGETIAIVPSEVIEYPPDRATKSPTGYSRTGMPPHVDVATNTREET